MHIPDTNGEIFLFHGGLIKIFMCVGTDFPESPSPYIQPSHRVELEGGYDVTRLVSNLTVMQAGKRSWAELEMKLPGFDGPFCVPEIAIGRSSA